MKRWIAITSTSLLVGLWIAGFVVNPVFADLSYTQGSGTTIFDFTCFTTKHCGAHVPINSAGTEIGTTSDPVYIDTPGSGNLETLLGTTNSTLSDINTNVQAGASAFTATTPSSGLAIGFSDGSGNLQSPAPTNPLPVGRANRVTSAPTVANASHTSGQCVGGFNAITVADNNGQTGNILTVDIASEGAVTPQVYVYLFSSNPSASTCTDNSTFTLNAADVSKMIAPPQAVTFVSGGATRTYASVSFTPPRAFIAGGSLSSGVKTIYYAIVNGTSSFTPNANGLTVTTGLVLN
jgi:hypothetical protein